MSGALSAHPNASSDRCRKPNPLSGDEQRLLFKSIPHHLAYMCLFKVNTGCREQEVCQLRWEWEIPIPELDTSVFLIPGEAVKNLEDRLVVLNRIAKSVVDNLRDINSELVFTYRGRPVLNIYNSAWRHAQQEVELKQPRCTT